LRRQRRTRTVRNATAARLTFWTTTFRQSPCPCPDSCVRPCLCPSICHSRGRGRGLGHSPSPASSRGGHVLRPPPRRACSSCLKTKHGGDGDGRDLASEISSSCRLLQTEIRHGGVHGDAMRKTRAGLSPCRGLCRGDCPSLLCRPSCSSSRTTYL
jgi:hypothetical protein